VEVVNVNDVIAETLKLAAPKLAARTRVERDLGRLPPWQGRPGRLGQVVLTWCSTPVRPCRRGGRSHRTA
jgi:hypothetical protein